MAGRVTSITAPDGPVTGLTWTVGGQLAARVFPDGTSEQREYDAEGNLISYLSPSGERSRYEYGPFDQLTAVTGPDGTRTEFRYDHAMRLTAVARAGLTWRYEYDAAGQVVAETDFNGAVTRYAYDPAGQLIGRVNAVGQEVSYGYDELGRLVRREAGAAVTSFGYDAAGLLVHARNPDAEITLSRDPLGRVTAETCNDRTVLSSFDLAGHRVRRVTPGGVQQRWRYDDAGQPVLLEVAGHTLRFGYDQAGRETRRDLPGAVALTQEWDAVGRLALQELAPADHLALSRRTTWLLSRRTPCMLSRRRLAGRAYAYRADGCLIGVDDLLAGSRRFTLDSGGRVAEVNGPGWAEQYRYDQAGNVASARWSSPPPGAASTWLSADLHGPRDRAGTLITSAGTVRYRHDRQGRVIRRQRSRISGKPDVWSYQWDPDDRLTAVTTPDGSTWRYRYDPLGRRISKQHHDPSGTLAEQTTFTWDGAVLAEESSGPPEAVRRRVTWDYRPGTFIPLTQSESVSTGDAAAEGAGERFYAIVADQVGAPAELVAADGTVAGYQQHTLWGGTLWHPAGPATPLRFPGQYYDAETGLHYNQQRYYDPVAGSYLSPDPLGLAPAPNPHAYVPNPLLQSDPLGLMSCDPDGDSESARIKRSCTRWPMDVWCGTRNDDRDWQGSGRRRRNDVHCSSGRPDGVRPAGGSTGVATCEFGVPRDSVVAAGKEGWAQIPGPDSLYGRLAAMRGLPIPQLFTPAVNVEWLLNEITMEEQRVRRPAGMVRGHKSSLASRGYVVEFAESPSDREQAVCFGHHEFSAPDRAAGDMGYGRGGAEHRRRHLGVITDDHREITTEIGLRDAVEHPSCVVERVPVNGESFGR